MAKLVRTVWVGGQHYGPNTPNPEPGDDVARQITNPLAWENGEVPFPAEDPAGESSGAQSAALAEEQAKSESTPRKATRARKKG